MADQPIQIGGGRRTFGDFAPKLAALTDDVLFEDVWNRPELSARDRSLVTVAVLAAGGHTGQLDFHLGRAVENGVTRVELIEAITHVTLYAGWPNGMAAMGVAKEHFHAAAPGVFMEHLAMLENGDDPSATTTWLEHVTDAQFTGKS